MIQQQRSRSRRRELTELTYVQWSRLQNGLIAYLDMQELQNAVARMWNPAGLGGILESNVYPGQELLTNYDFSNGLTGWTVITSNPPNSEVSESGGQVTFSNVSEDPILDQGAVLAIGTRVIVTIDIASISAGQFRVADQAGGMTGNFTIAGVQSYEAIVTNAGLRLRQNTPGICVLNSISIRPVNPMNGDINGATIGQWANPFILYEMLFGGAVNYIDIYSVELNSFLAPQLMSLSGMLQPDSGAVWSDGNVRAVMNLEVDANNRVQVGSDGAGNFQAIFASGGVTRTLTYPTTSGERIGWAVRRNGADVEWLVDGVVVDTDTGLAAWVGNLNANLCTIGAANDTPVNVWHGGLSHWKMYDVWLPSYVAYEDARRAGTIP